MFSHLIPDLRRQLRRPRTDDNNSDDEDEDEQQNKQKKLKTSHNKNDSNTTTTTTTDLSVVVHKVLFDESLFPNITSFLVDNHNNPTTDEEYQLALCCRSFYRHFAERAQKTFNNNDIFPTGEEFRGYVISKAVLATRAWQQRQQELRGGQSFWSWLWGTLRRRPQRRLLSYRFWVKYAYKVPLERVGAFNFGPSCGGLFSTTTATTTHQEEAEEQKDALFCLTATGLVLPIDVSTMEIEYVIPTQQADGGVFLSQYNWIFDELWYCHRRGNGGSNRSNNDNNDNNKGLLVLRHLTNLGGENLDVRVMDLAQTNQDVGRGERDLRGMAQRRIAPSQDFQTAFTRPAGTKSVTVSTQHGFIYFVGNSFNDVGTIGIESYDATSGELVASNRHVITGWNVYVAGRLGILRPLTKVVATQDKLVVAYYAEENQEAIPSLDGFGFGIYVFNCHDLTLDRHVRMFHEPVVISELTENWLLYDKVRTTDIAVQITGGNVHPSAEMNRGNCRRILLVTGNSVYACDEGQREGDIEIDQFNLVNGTKVRTLETGIPWEFVDADLVDGRPLHRTMAGAHAVGNKLIFLISSVGLVKNTIVTFASPSS